MSIIAAFKGASLLNKIGVGVVPVILTIMVPVAWWIGGERGETRGHNGRNEEVTKLEGSVATLKQDLTDLKAEMVVVKDERTNLLKEKGAREEQHAKALLAQSRTLSASQKATSQAMALLAAKGKENDDYFEDLKGQVPGLHYTCDKNGEPLIIGGGKLLRDGAMGVKKTTGPG